MDRASALTALSKQADLWHAAEDVERAEHRSVSEVVNGLYADHWTDYELRKQVGRSVAAFHNPDVPPVGPRTIDALRTALERFLTVSGTRSALLNGVASAAATAKQAEATYNEIADAARVSNRYAQQLVIRGKTGEWDTTARRRAK